MSYLFIFVIISILKLFSATTTEQSCPDDCLAYFDGCNTCNCGNSVASDCTSRVCRTTGAASCTKCSSNFEWNDCGSWCTKTCGDPSPLCPAECIPKCECPPDKPIYSNGVCIAYIDCVPQQSTSVCPSDCATYFDGCNTCTCNSDGSMTCSDNVCTTYTSSYCIECKNNLQWDTCGTSCTKTCTDLNPSSCSSYCVPRCRCPEHKPIYYNGICIAADECSNFQSICPGNCTNYFDGCNNCTCLNGEDDACTNNVCLTQGTPECTNCTSNFVWNSCGKDCTPTCTDPEPACSDDCVARCECPPDFPYYENGTCVTMAKCLDPPATTVDPRCPFGCESYFDGCNTCSCNSDGSIGTCTNNNCSVYGEAKCLTCENNLQWNNCSTCLATCNNTNACSETSGAECVARCECPPDAPIYYGGKCISEQYCYNFQNVCPGNCTVYFDGCNTCECYDDIPDACTNNICTTKTTPQCLNCVNDYVWTESGSSCPKTCEDPNRSCAGTKAKCDCPASKPIHKNGTCIAYSSCDCECTSIPLPNGVYVESRTQKCAAETTQKDCKNIKMCIWKCH